VGRWANWATGSWATRNCLTCWATEKKDWAARLIGPEGGKEKGGKNKFFLPFSKELTKLEFKHKFEFKQIKTVQQHECNSKLL
jgi:hypothetical protein